MMTWPDMPKTKTGSNMKYRKRPVVIEAVQWYPGGRPVKGVCRLADDPAFDGDDQPHVHTIHDNQAIGLAPGDWIVPEPDGEHFYPVKPDIFEQTYEAVV